MPQIAESITEIPFTCTLDCGSRCQLVAHVRDGEILRVDTPTGQSDTHVRPRLIPCVRGRAQRRARTARERVLHPMKRSGSRGSGSFETISWDEALDEIAGRLAQLQAQHGTEALFHATGAGAIGGRGFSGGSASGRFFSHWGPVTETAGNMSNHCAVIAEQWMLGRRVPGSDRATLCDAKLILLWGMNPAETHMGPNTAHFIAEARDRGARVILIDPRYTDSGVLADQWVPIRPGTDAALAAAMAYVIDTEGLSDRAFLETHTAGYEAYRQYLTGESDGIAKTPAWGETQSGVPAETIRQLARDYATVKPAALLPGWGPQRTVVGEQAARAFITLACISGNVGIRGGSLASTGTRLSGIPIRNLPHGPHRATRHLSASTWAKALLKGIDPSVRMAYIVASNLINRSPNTQANVRALDAFDHIVVQDPFFTPTARLADFVLPICTELERCDLVTSWGHDSHLFHSRQAAEPLGEAKTDYWVFAQLAARLGFADAYTRGKSEAEWVAELGSARHLDRAALESEGIMRTDGEPRVALSAYRADPNAHPLDTPSGKIEIVTPQAEDYGLPVIPSYVVPERSTDGALQLVTPHSKLRSNSCLHATPWLQRLDPHVVWIHPQDAAERGIADQDTVEVYSRQGTIRLPAKVTERIMPGVVCVYQGTWFQPTADGFDKGACANTLTPHVESPTGGLATHSAWVDVRRCQI